MRRVLVTGATGFVGRHTLAPLARRGFEVVAVTSRRPLGSCDCVRWMKADLLTPGAPAAVMAEVRPTHLLHCAWYAEHGAFWTAVENFSWLLASIPLLEAFAEAGGRRVVTAGTCAEYDWDAGVCEEERTPLRPRTTYGVCKNALHAVQGSLCSRTGVSAAWGRLFLLYGPHENPARLIPSVINALLDGGRARCTDGGQVRDLLHVQDAADALVSLLESEVEGPVNIASGDPIALRDAVILISELAGAPFGVDFGAIPRRDGDPLVLLGDTRRLRKEVGWFPDHDLLTGVDETVRWWKEQRRA